MITESSVSRTRAGLFSPCSMMAEILLTSMNVTDKVRISVPKGSPKRTARCSAWRTTDRAEPRITLNSQRNVAFRTSGLARAESSASPTTEKTAQVRRGTERNQSERQLVGLSVVFAAFNKRVYASCPAPVPQSVGKGEHEETMPNYAHLCKAPSQPLRDLILPGFHQPRRPGRACTAQPFRQPRRAACRWLSDCSR